MGTCCSSVKQSENEKKKLTSNDLQDVLKNDKQEESTNKYCECRKDNYSKQCSEPQEKNPQIPKIGINISKNDISEGEKFLTMKKNKERSLLSVSVQIPKSRDEESNFRYEKNVDDKETNSNQFIAVKSVKKEQEKAKAEQNMVIFNEVCNSSLNRETESMDRCHSRNSLPIQPIITDITDYMDVHTLHSSLRTNDACLERMFRRADVAMETLSKSMCYAKRRQKSSLAHSCRTFDNECQTRNKASMAGIRQVNKGTDGRRAGRPGPGSVDGTNDSRLPGKPRLCWQ